MSKRVLVRLIGHGSGERHMRLRTIWKALDKAFDWLEVRWLWHDGSHQEGLTKNWELGPDGARVLVLTEEDFLPRIAGLRNICSAREAPVIGCSYRMRTNHNLGLADPPGYWGGWFLAFRSDVIPQLGKPYFGGRDPGNHVQQHCDACKVQSETLNGIDGLRAQKGLEHYGIEYTYGTHLFWSRHLHDNPNTVISGVRLGDMQAAHDRFVEHYILGMKRFFPEFRRAYEALSRTTSRA